MNLRKQLFAAFLSVAIVPLIVFGVYMFGTNLMLAFKLYEQNLQNSAEIQAGLVEENINSLMVRTGRFASSRAVRDTCKNGFQWGINSEDLSKDILNFTDETLDNVSVFALLDQNGTLLYSSGSNDDTDALLSKLPELEPGESSYVKELFLNEQTGSLVIVTPVKEDAETIGSFLVVCRTDHFLRIISSHKQVESSNAFIYCPGHRQAVVSKMNLSGDLPELDKKLELENQGALICRVGAERSLVYYRALSKTPWYLVSTISAAQILSRTWNFGLMGFLVLLFALLAVPFISHRQSKKMLQPLNRFLNVIEQFFVSGATKFPELEIDPKTEIGYLAEKFVGMSDEIAIMQRKLRESNYLYATILQATYEFRLVLDLQTDTAECSSGILAEHLGHNGSVSERALAFLSQGKPDQRQADTDLLKKIVYGQTSEPAEAEVCFDLGDDQGEKWYRLITVPITNTNGAVQKVVIHFEDITRQKRREFRLIHTSQVDPLCGLYNKTAFPLCCKMSDFGKSDAVFFIDLDRFKQVNDTMGHAAGDEVLVATAQAISGQFRGSDTVGRFGGDEFVVFAPNMTKPLAESKAQTLVHALSFQRVSPQGVVLHVTASIGVCVTKNPMTLEQAIRKADEAMYRAKENGKSQYYLVKCEEPGTDFV